MEIFIVCAALGLLVVYLEAHQRKEAKAKAREMQALYAFYSAQSIPRNRSGGGHRWFHRGVAITLNHGVFEIRVDTFGARGYSTIKGAKRGINAWYSAQEAQANTPARLAMFEDLGPLQTTNKLAPWKCEILEQLMDAHRKGASMSFIRPLGAGLSQIYEEAKALGIPVKGRAIASSIGPKYHLFIEAKK